MRWSFLLVCLLLPALPALADDTYTPAEMRALDRALHAANMTREDLAFQKDVTKGHAALPVVREMLKDPLRIAPVLDELAAEKPTLPAIVDAAAAFLEAAWIPSSPPAEHGARAAVTTLDLLAEWRHVLERTHEAVGTPPKAVRLALPAALAWHDVFASPFDAETTRELEAYVEDQPDDWLHARANEVDLRALVGLWHTRLADFGLAGLHDLEGAFPADAPVVVETPYGRIGLGTRGNDVYEGDFAVLIDPGGDDTYRDCRIGAAYGTERGRVGFFADLGGDDVYDCADVDFTLGAAILGIAVFCDLGQGDDRYRGGHASLGAAMGGVAVFYDDGGADVYEGRTFTQGAAGFGIGIFHDDAVHPAPEVPTDEATPDPIDLGSLDNDRLSAWSNAQAFARCRGVALCLNTRGNEIYEAGGVYLHAPLFSDRYQSFSQGFSIGQRNIDYAGGLAALIDRDGNDRYLGDIYNQGVGYWYGAGLLYDGGGNDTYEMTQYGQGSGIHLAVGGLVDVAGHDTYVMHSGLGQGSSHDYAVSILHDRAGNDRYLGSTSCNGAALTNSVGIHIDRTGDDTYAGRRKGAINFGRPARGFDSIGVLLDLAGTDDYLGIMEDDTLWRHTHIGVGWDTSPEPRAEAPGGVTPAADQPSGRAEVPEICAYEGELTQEVFDELWAIAVRWEVGDNRYIVPKARERLIAFGPEVLAYLDAVLEESSSGLEMRAYVDVLKALREGGHGDIVVDLLERNFAHEVERRQRVALYLTGELGISELEGEVVALLGSEVEGLPRRAASVLRQLESHAGDETLKAWLAPERNELEIQAALGTLLGLEGDVYADVRPLLDHPLLSVRTRLVQLLVEHAAVYLDAAKADLVAEDLSARARRTVLEVLVRTKPTPDAADALAATVLLEHPDWGMRADAVRLVRAWVDDVTIDREVLAPALDALTRLLETEDDPYVRFCLER